MSKKTKITGQWWIFGKEEESQFGFLFLCESGIKLKIFNPVNRTQEEALVASTRQRPIASTVFGRDEENHPVTLINCLCTRDQLGRNRDEYEIVAGVCIRGQEVNSLDKSLAKYVTVSPHKFHRWLGGRFMRSASIRGEKVTWTQSRGLKLDFAIAEGVSLTITQMTLPSRSLDKLVFKPHCNLALAFEEFRSLEEIMIKWVPSVIRFFSLLYGNRFHWDSIGYMVENPFSSGPDEASERRSQPEGGRITTHSSLTKAHENDEVYLPWILAPFEKVKAHLPDMLVRWSEVDERLRPAIDLFWAVAFRRSLYAEAAFLFLVQALEVYHAQSVSESTQLPPKEHKRRVKVVIETAPKELKEWLKHKIESANYKRLGERLLEIFRHHPAETSELFRDSEATVKRIVYTRNYLIHHSTGRESPRLLNDQELMKINNALERLFWIIFLKEAGLPASLVTEAWKSLKNLRGISAD